MRLKLLTGILSVAGVCVQLIVTLLLESTSGIPNSTATGTPIDQGKGKRGEGGGGGGDYEDGDLTILIASQNVCTMSTSQQSYNYTRTMEGKVGAIAIIMSCLLFPPKH